MTTMHTAYLKFPLFVKFFNCFWLAVFALNGVLSAKELIPLEIITHVHDLGKVRNAIRGGFEDIVASPVVVNQGVYMQVRLEPNGFITMQEHKCDIHLVETIKGLKIIAIPYDEVGGKKVEVTDFTVRKGVYMMIEGAAEELNYEAKKKTPIPANLGGFINFTLEMQRLVKELEKGQAPVVDVADFPKKGRTFRLVTPNNSGMIQMEEDPAKPDQAIRLWVIQDMPTGEPPSPIKDDAKIIGKWIKELRSELLKGGGSGSLDKDFFVKPTDQFSAGGFDVSISNQPVANGTKKILLLQDSAPVKASKNAY